MTAVLAGYVYFATGKEVARTVEATPHIFFDLDKEDRIIGVETLGATDWASGILALAMAGRLTVPRRGDPGP